MGGDTSSNDSNVHIADVNQDDSSNKSSSTAPTKEMTKTKNNNWSIWRAIEKLEQRKKDFYPEITSKVIDILNDWGTKWQDNSTMASVLNKSTLHHELEETIVAIHYLLEGLERHPNVTKCHVLDACAGKGMLSFLLSYFRHPKIVSIIMIEKATIDWSHIVEANRTTKAEGRPKIGIWNQTNLHDYDSVLDRLLSLPHPIAMCGIHLCKQLGPSFCGLYNGLGPKCLVGCLSPCCMPRAVTTQKKKQNANKQLKKTFSLSIQLHETWSERRSRRDYMLRRELLRRRCKPTTGPCYYCKDQDHSILGCPQLKSLPEDQQVSIRRAWHAATVPCWNCLEIGHFKENCPILDGKGRSSGHTAQQPPTILLDVTGILQTPNPYSAYCHVLADGFQKKQQERRQEPKVSSTAVSNSSRVRVIETGLEKIENHGQTHWNAGRKSIFIVAD